MALADAISVVRRGPQKAHPPQSARTAEETRREARYALHSTPFPESSNLSLYQTETKNELLLSCGKEEEILSNSRSSIQGSIDIDLQRNVVSDVRLSFSPSARALIEPSRRVQAMRLINPHDSLLPARERSTKPAQHVRCIKN